MSFMFNNQEYIHICTYIYIFSSALGFIQVNAKTSNVVKVDYILLRIIRGYIFNSTTQSLIIDHDEGLINSDEYSQVCEEKFCQMP